MCYLQCNFKYYSHSHSNYWFPKYPFLSYSVCNIQPLTFRNLSKTIFNSRHIILSLQLIKNVTLQNNYMNTQVLIPYHHQDWVHTQPQLHFPETYSLFSQERYYKTQKCTSLLLFTISQYLIQYYLQLYLTYNIIVINQWSTVDPSGTRQTYIHSSCHVPSPILPPRKITTDDPSVVLLTKLYTSVYFIRANAPHRL